MGMGVKSFERWKVGGKVRHDDLEEVAGVQQIFETVHAEVAKMHAGGQVIGDDAARGLRKQHLPTMSRCSDARGAVDVEPNIALAAPLRLAGVQSYARWDSR